MNIYEEAFRGNIRYGYATAKSTILFVIVLIITLIQLRVMKSREAELWRGEEGLAGSWFTSS